MLTLDTLLQVYYLVSQKNYASQTIQIVALEQ